MAAGCSFRAGSFKLAWELEGEPLLVRQIRLFAGHCSSVLVVAGHWTEEVKQLCSGMPSARVVENSEYQLGMFSSVLCGARHVTGPMFICPADMPTIRSQTLAALIEASGDVRIPTFCGRRGHPLFFGDAARRSLLNQPVQSNLRQFIGEYGAREVPVQDPGIRMDIDTREDYENIIKLLSLSAKEGIG